MINQVLLCLECNDKSRTDYVYVESTINRFYNKNSVIYKPIFLGSKTKYNSKDKQKEIRERMRQCKGETRVIYFIDLDDYDVSYETKKLYDEIKEFCQRNGHDLVFFCKDVEDVYLGKTVDDDEKVKVATKFKKSKAIGNVDESKLNVNCYRKHCSNILNILDKYWERKH